MKNIIVNLIIILFCCKPILCSEIKLTASDGEAGDEFGNAVSISGDYAIVAAVDDDKDGNLNYGSAYIFIRKGKKWIEETKLLVDDCAYRFGTSVSISDNYAIVGAQDDDINGRYSGSAYIFIRKGNLWERQAKIFPDDGSENDEFGFSVSISGNYAIVGCALSNKAYIYIRNENIWTQDTKINDGDGALSSVSIYGNYAIVGSPNNNTTGSVFIYVLNEKSWQHHKTLTPEDLSTRCFGHSVSISNDYAIIGVRYEKSLDIGTAYIYKKNMNNWEQQIKLNPINGENNDYFGTSVAISNNYAIVGVPYDDDNTENSGSVYIYQLIDNQWLQKVKLTSNDNAKDDRYGISVSISDDYAIVGADYNDSKGNGSGTAYIYPTTTTQAPIITGIIKDIRGKPFQGATIEFENWKTVHTNESGFFQVEVSFRWTGNATIFYNDYIFNPQQIEYKVITEDITDQLISISVFTISGFIKDIIGNPIPGIEIVFSNNGGSTFTNSLGYYSHDVYHNWTGIAKAQGKGYKFEPIIRSYENVSQDYYNQNCHASKPSLSGFCFDKNNQPIENVEVHLSTNDDKYLSDDSGFFNIDVDYHWNGKISAVKTGYIFEPEFFEYYDLINSCGNQNFIGNYQNTLWNVDVTNFKHQGMITSIVKDNSGNILQSEDDILAAFVNNECRGLSKPSLVSDGKRFFLQVWSNEYTEVMRFKFYDSKNNIIYEQISSNIQFSPDFEIGNIKDPQIFWVNKANHVPDANNDGEVNVIDAIEVLKYISNFRYE